MSSEEEKFKGYRPYFAAEPTATDDPELKEIAFMPSTIETIDMALNDWLSEDMDIFCNTNEGWRKFLLFGRCQKGHSK